MAKKIEMLNDQQEVVHPLTSSDCVIMENGKTLEEVMGDGIATPTVTHEGASFQVGVGDSNIEVVDGDVAGMILEGQTYQNILPKPTTLIMETDEQEFKINDKIDNNIVLDDNIAEIATVKGQTYVNVVQEESSTEYTVLGEELSGQSIATSGKPEGIIKNATLEGMTLVNTIQEPSEASSVVLDLDADINAQRATIDNTVQGGIKSAILKGQTLVNLCNASNRSETLTSSSRIFYCKIPYTIKANSVYTFFAKISNSTTSGNINLQYTHPDGTYSYPKMMDASTNGVVNLNIVNAKDITDIIIYISNMDTGQVTVSDVMIIEGDYANVNVPYFEGMQSVRMPVLTTVGKNFKQGSPIGNFTENNGEYVFTNMSNRNGIRFDVDNTMKIGDTITVSVDCKKNEDFGNNLILLAMNNDVELINKSVPFSMAYERKSLTTTIPDNTTHLFLGIGTSLYRNVSFNNIQIEKGSVSTSYEPYKTNILSTSDDVELRGVGDVTDELNCLTGEVTERIGEIVLNGSENWIINTLAVNNKVITFYGRMISDAKVIPNVVNYTSDKIASLRNELWDSDEVEGFLFMNNKQLAIKIKRETASTSEELVTYLSQNPITIQYQLETESIKTVDLSIVDQDNNSIKSIQAQPTLTHITTSSNGLIPFVTIPSQLKYPTIIKPSTTYTVQLKQTTTNSEFPLTINLGGTTMAMPSTKFTITTPETLTSQDVIFTGKNNVIGEVVITEGDTTGIEYKFFEGMNDVKSPRLLARGKNLYNPKTILNGYTISTTTGLPFENNSRFTTDYICVKNINNVTISLPENIVVLNVWGYDENKNPIIKIKNGFDSMINVLTIPAEIYYIRMPIGTSNNSVITDDNINANIQIEEGSTATSYEPYKGVTIEQDIDSIPLTSGMFEQGGYNGGSTSIVKGMSVQQFPISQRADRIKSKTLIKVKPNATYSINDLRLSAITFDKNGGYNNIIDFCTSFTTDSNTYYLGINLSKTGNSDITPSSLDSLNLTLQEVTDEIVLRSIGDVKDTLNLTTGEYVQRIGEVVLNGSESWEPYRSVNHGSGASTYQAYCTNRDLPKTSLNNKINCDRLVQEDLGITGNANVNRYPCNYIHNYTDGTYPINRIFISVNKEMFGCDSSIDATDSTTKFKQYLQQNPITVQYKLATPIIKKVNLTNTTKLPSYTSTTHYDTIVPSNSLAPNIKIPSTVDYNVAIKPSTQYTIRANTTSAMSVDLGGSAGVLANGKVTLTTPSTLAHNSLKLGNGKAKEVMVIEGSEIKDNVPFFNGMKNVQMGGIKLVNIARGATVDSDKIVINTNKTQFTYTSTGGSSWSSISFDVKLLKPNTLYTVYMNIVKNTLAGNASSAGGAKICLGDSGNKWLEIGTTTGIYCKTMKTTDRTVRSDFGILIRPNTEGQQLIVKDFMVFEGDWTHLDEIPFIESEMIIEQPIIRSQGKNLFDINNESNLGSNYTKNGNSITCNATSAPIFGFNGLDSNKSYTIAFDYVNNNEESASNSLAYAFSDEKRIYSSSTSYNVKLKGNYTVGQTTREVYVLTNKNAIWVQGAKDATYSNIQIEEGSTTTSYEPFKHQTLYSNRVIGYEEGCYYHYGTGNKETNEIVNSVLADVEGLSIAYVTGGSSNYTFWDKDNVFISGKRYLDTSLSSYDKNGFIAVPSNAKYMRFAAGIETNYKITTVTGELPLRSLPNGVCDSFNLVTGEYVQRVGEVVLDGSEENIIHDGVSCKWVLEKVKNMSATFYSRIIINNSIGNDKKTGCIITNTFREIPYVFDLIDGEQEGINNSSLKILRVNISKQRLSSVDVDGFKQYLSQNPITVQYELATPIVRKIGLTAKGNYKEVELNGRNIWTDGNNGTNNIKCARYYVAGSNITTICPNVVENSPIIVDNVKERVYGVDTHGDYEYISFIGQGLYYQIYKDKLQQNTVDEFRKWLSQNPLKIGYLSTDSASLYSNIQKPIFFNNVNVQFMNNNIDIQPTLTLQARSRNSYIMDMMKPNTLYTSKFLQSANGSTFIDGTVVSMKINNTFTSPSTLTNKLMITPLNRQEFMIIEGDVTRFTIPYYKGIRSAYDNVNEIEVLSVNKNLFNINGDINEIYSNMGGYYENELLDDGGLKANNWTTSYHGRGQILKLKPNTTYTITGTVKNYGTITMHSKTKTNLLYCNHNNTSFVDKYTTKSDETELCLCFATNGGNNAEKAIFYNIQIEEASTATPYQQHQHNTTSLPMPTRLETVKVVRPEMENGVINTGNGANAEDTTNSYLRSDFIPVQPKEFIYFLNGNSDRVVNIICYNKDKNFMCYLYNSNDYVPENCYFVRIYMGKANTSDLTMIRMAYKPIQLNSLPNGVKDEIIIEPVSNKAKLIQRVGKVVFDGSEVWATNGTYPNKATGYMCQKYTDAKLSSISLISNILPTIEIVDNNDTMNDKPERFLTRTTGTGKIQFISKTPFDSINQLKNWLQQNPITVYYELATPITHEVRLTGFPFVYEDGSVQLNTELPHKTLVDYNVNQEQLINNQNETIIRHDKQIDNLYDYIELYLEEEYRMELFRMQLELSL